MEDIFQTETTIATPPENDIRLFLREIIRDELKRQNKKQKKKNGKKKSKKKDKKANIWETLAIKSVHTVIENGIPALFRKWESCGREKVGKGGK